MRAMDPLTGNATDAGVARILVVDDDAILGRSLAGIIQQYGGDVTVVGSARLAMEQIANVAAWTALILDVSLPDGSGLDVLRRARAADPSVPALILTGFLDRDVPNAAFDLRAEYLVKPASATQLNAFLRRVPVGQGHRVPAPLVSEDLPDDLWTLVVLVRDAAAAQGIAHAEYAYRMALLARTASGRTHRGHSVVDLCAKAANVSHSTLQQYIAVTTRWPPATVRHLLGRRDCQGRVVTLSHLVAVARAPAQLRRHLERVIWDGTDLRQLRASVARKEIAGAVKGESDVPAR
jgi:DNA-binding response OmpR family regulator